MPEVEILPFAVHPTEVPDILITQRTLLFQIKLARKRA